MADKSLDKYIKGVEKVIKDLKSNQATLVAANNKNPVPNIRKQIDSLKAQILEAEKSLKEAKRIAKNGYG